MEKIFTFDQDVVSIAIEDPIEELEIDYSEINEEEYTTVDESKVDWSTL